MRKRLVMLAALGSVASAVLGGLQPAVGDAGTHTIFIRGISTVVKQCQYVWDTQAASATGDTGVRDDLGIPKPKTLPPTCQKDAQGHDVACTLKRNLGTYPSPTQTGAPWDQLRSTINPPCSGVLTAETNVLDNDAPGGYGACVDAGDQSNTHCRLDAPTWFYGYCAQTYGGDTILDGVGTPGFLELNGIKWRLDALGFPRGRGIWEFGAKLSRTLPNGTDRTTARFYLDALPNKLPNEGTACDGGPNITSVEFFGFFVIPAPPVKLFRTKPGWHVCADDPGFNVPLVIGGQTIPPSQPVPGGYTPQGC